MKYIKFFLLLAIIALSYAEIFANSANKTSSTHENSKAKVMDSAKTHPAEDDQESYAPIQDATKILNIYGSSTVSVILSKYIGEIEHNLNIKINLIASNSKDGLIALQKGEADIAMLSTNPSNFTKQIPGLSIKDVKSFCIGDTNIVFIVNKKNNIKNTRVDDIKAVLAGVVTNWKQLNSSLDDEILVVTEYPGGGIRSFVESEIMYQPLTIEMKQMIDSSQLIEVVSKVPHALGISAMIFVEGQDVDVIKTERSISSQLYLVAKEKTEEVKSLVDAIRTYNIGGNIKKYIEQEKANEKDAEEE